MQSVRVIKVIMEPKKLRVRYFNCSSYICNNKSILVNILKKNILVTQLFQLIMLPYKQRFKLSKQSTVLLIYKLDTYVGLLGYCFSKGNNVGSSSLGTQFEVLNESFVNLFETIVLTICLITFFEDFFH